MKINRFFNINLMLIAVLLTAGITMSYKITEKKSADTTYFYNSSDVSPNAYSDTSHWETTNNSTCLTTGTRPCKIIVPAGQTLSSMIAGKSNAQVLAISTDRKP